MVRTAVALALACAIGEEVSTGLEFRTLLIPRVAVVENIKIKWFYPSFQSSTSLSQRYNVSGIRNSDDGMSISAFFCLGVWVMLSVATWLQNDYSNDGMSSLGFESAGMKSTISVVLMIFPTSAPDGIAIIVNVQWQSIKVISMVTSFKNRNIRDHLSSLACKTFTSSRALSAAKRPHYDNSDDNMCLIGFYGYVVRTRHSQWRRDSDMSTATLVCAFRED